MGDKSRIEWTDASWNPIRARCAGKVGWHCEKVSEGCRNCYSESMNRRLGTVRPFKAGERRNGVELFLDEKMLTQPLRWEKPRKIFPCSMTDLFADFVPDEWIDKVFAVMALTPHHTHQILTKRTARMRQYCESVTLARLMAAASSLPESLGPRAVPAQWPLPNVWHGTSICNQDDADKFIPELLATPAAVRFVSCEPLLGPVHLLTCSVCNSTKADFCNGCRCARPMRGLDWVICGDESGPGRRFCSIDWVRGLRDQCAVGGVPFFLKQLHINRRKVAMPELDGRVWDQMPAQETEAHHEDA